MAKVLKNFEFAPDVGEYYIWGEDLVEGLVGPFYSLEAAEEHVEFQRERGDAAVLEDTAKIMNREEAMATWAWKNNLCTPERDRALDVG